MKILYINNYFPIFVGTDSGASNRSTMFITALSKIADVDIISFRGDKLSTINNCRIIQSDEIQSIEKQHRLDKLCKLFAFRSPERIYTVNNEKEKIVDRYLLSGKYDYVACRYIREAVECGLVKYSNKLILDVDDNPKDVILMAAKNAKTFRNRLYNRLFAYTMDIMVKHILQNVAYCFHSNPRQAPIKGSIFLHNVTMVNAELPAITDKTPLQIMMVGLFHYGPNIDGLKHFLRNVWSLVYQHNPNVRLNVIGKINSPDILNQFSAIDGVTFKGFVPDLINEYQNSRVIIVPIYSGSGTSVKVVEAMRMNRACISTPEGIRGYDKYLVDKQDFLLVETDLLFAQQIVELVNDVTLCNKIAASARNKMEKHFSNEKFIEIVINTIKTHTS